MIFHLFEERKMNYSKNIMLFLQQMIRVAISLKNLRTEFKIQIIAQN